MAVTYNLWLVALSYLIAVVASFTALDLGSRVTLTTGRAAKVWLIGGAIVAQILGNFFIKKIIAIKV